TRCRELMDQAIAVVKPGATTADVVSLWPRATEFGFPDETAAFGLQYGHGVGLSIWEKPIFSRLVSLDHPEPLEEGMVFAIETYWLVRGADRGRARCHGGRLRGHHEVPGRGAPRGRAQVLDRGRRPEHGAGQPVAPEYRRGTAGARLAGVHGPAERAGVTVIPMKVGFAGLGRMGAPMAARIAEHGFPLTVWNRTAGRTEPLARHGASVAGTLHEVAAGSHVVITMLSDGEAALAVWAGPGGLLETCAP